MSVKLVHFADFHLGYEQGPIDPSTRLGGRVMDYLDAFDAMTEFATDNRADLIVCAGDIFHRHAPDPTYVRELGERLTALPCKILLVPGNHDLPGSLDRAGAIDLFGVLQAPNVILGWAHENIVIDTPGGQVAVTTFPYPLKAQFLSATELKDRGSSAAHHTYTHRVAGLLKKLGKELPADLPSLLVGHFAVDQAVYGSERPMIIGQEAEVSLSSLLAWDYAALGHIHMYQRLNEKPPVIYSGSLERVDFSDEHVNKGFMWVELNKGCATAEFIKIDARPYATLIVDVRGVDKPTAKVINVIRKADLAGAVVKVYITVEQDAEHRLHLELIHQALKQAGAYIVHAVRLNVERGERARLEHTTKPIAQMTHMELLGLYFDLMGEEEPAPLLNLAQDIMSEVSEGLS